MNFFFGVYFIAFGVLYWQLASVVRGLPARRDPRLSLKGSLHIESHEHIMSGGAGLMDSDDEDEDEDGGRSGAGDGSAAMPTWKIKGGV